MWPQSGDVQQQVFAEWPGFILATSNIRAPFHRVCTKGRISAEQNSRRAHSDTSPYFRRARGSVVGPGTMLQAGRSRSIQDEVIPIYNCPNPSIHTWPWGRPRLLTQISTRNLPEGKGRPARKGNNLTATCETSRLSRKCGSLDGLIQG
jgi:hypothetical protein